MKLYISIWMEAYLPQRMLSTIITDYMTYSQSI